MKFHLRVDRQNVVCSHTDYHLTGRKSTSQCSTVSDQWNMLSVRKKTTPERQETEARPPGS